MILQWGSLVIDIIAERNLITNVRLVGGVMWFLLHYLKVCNAWLNVVYHSLGWLRGWAELSNLHKLTSLAHIISIVFVFCSVQFLQNHPSVQITKSDVMTNLLPTIGWPTRDPQFPTKVQFCWYRTELMKYAAARTSKPPSPSNPPQQWMKTPWRCIQGDNSTLMTVPPPLMGHITWSISTRTAPPRPYAIPTTITTLAHIRHSPIPPPRLDSVTGLWSSLPSPTSSPLTQALFDPDSGLTAVTSEHVPLHRFIAWVRMNTQFVFFVIFGALFVSRNSIRFSQE